MGSNDMRTIPGHHHCLVDRVPPTQIKHLTTSQTLNKLAGTKSVSKAFHSAMVGVSPADTNPAPKQRWIICDYHTAARSPSQSEQLTLRLPP
jgi:hypothetical protein